MEGDSSEMFVTKEMEIRSTSSSRGAVSLPYKVSLPPKEKFWTEFSSTLKETFFSDDPLHSFKDQSRSRKFVLGLQAVFPILEWAKTYNLSKFKGDLIAGLTIASLCIPQVYAYIIICYNGLIADKITRHCKLQFYLNFKSF